MPRKPRGKRSQSADGSRTVAAKNPNGDGSVFYEPPTLRASGRPRPGRWRATYVAADGKIRRVTAPTRVEAEARRDEKRAEVARSTPTSSRFDSDTTVNQLLDWWLETVARHQVKTSTLDSYGRFAGYLADGIGTYRVVDVDSETLAAWQSDLLDRYAPYTVLNSRKVCRQAFLEAVKLRLILSNPFDLVKAPRAKTVSSGRALTPDEAKALITAAEGMRLGAAVTLLFCQGWRVSEVLGLAWEDLELDAGTAQIRRGAAYTPTVGTVLGTTKTSGAEGIHYLAPISVERLRQRRDEQAVERELAGTAWESHLHGGQRLNMVFTTRTGALVNRQNVVKTIERAATKAGLDPSGIATHTGRRTVITALYLLQNRNSTLAGYMVAATLGRLRPADATVLLVPANWLHANYARAMRDWMWRRTPRDVEVHILQDQGLFPDANIAASILAVGPARSAARPLKLKLGTPMGTWTSQTWRATSGTLTPRRLRVMSVVSVNVPPTLRGRLPSCSTRASSLAHSYHRRARRDLASTRSPLTDPRDQVQRSHLLGSHARSRPTTHL